MKIPYDDDSLKRYLREIAIIQPLTSDEETELLLHVQAQDKEKELASKRLIEANLPLVVSIAEQFSSSGIHIVALIEEGNLGLLNAVRTFAVSRHTFADHAAGCIKEAIFKRTRLVNERKARIAKIEVAIRKDSEDFFDDEDLKVLRIVIRIACEFYELLQKFEGVPDLDEASYMAGTIRAGMDEFVGVSAWGRILTDTQWGKSYCWNSPSSFVEMKASYASIFQQLSDCTSCVKGVQMLLALSQMMLFFMAVYFAWL
jgi:RNA polymerase sigma factor (sigma-70 family)